MASVKKKNPVAWLQLAVLRAARVHFLFAAAAAVVFIAADAGQLVTSEMVSQRWVILAVMTFVTILAWYLAHGNMRAQSYYQVLLVAMVLTDIIFVSYLIYIDRGMASRAVALYSVPIATAALLLNRSAIYGAAAVSTVGYVLVATRYFYVHFNEGYRLELYTALGLYGAGFFALAALLWAAIKAKTD